jgi:hypothetical protein
MLYVRIAAPLFSRRVCHLVLPPTWNWDKGMAVALVRLPDGTFLLLIHDPLQRPIKSMADRAPR